MPRAFSRRSAVCAPSRRRRRSIAAKPKPTPSAVEPSSDLIHKVKKLKYYKVKGCLGKAVSDAQFNFLPFKLLTFRSSLPGKEVANCFYQTVNVVALCFDFDLQTVVARSLRRDWANAGNLHSFRPR